MSKKVGSFWKKWCGSDELDRVRLVKTLILPTRTIEDKELFRHHCATLINSYLTDLEGYLTEKGEKNE